MKKKNPKFLTKLKSFFSIGEITQVPVDVTDSNYRSISEDELKSIMKRTYVNEPTGKPPLNRFQIPGMLEPIGRELIDRRMDHEKLMSLAPEIEQAAAILIPSILSPNDFRKNVFEVVIKGGNEIDAVKGAIVKLINTHFDGELDLSVKLSTWVSDAMFKFGGKAIMILPTSAIGNLREKIGTTESLGAVTKSLLDDMEGSLESIKSTDIRSTSHPMYDPDEVISRVVATAAIENLISSEVATRTDSNRDKEISRVVGLLKRGLGVATKHFDSKNLIQFSDDPRMLLKPKISNSAALETIDAKILSKLGQDPKPVLRDRKDGITGKMRKSELSTTTYSYHPYIDLSEYIVDDNAEAFPAVMELPYESVIPIIVEGAPSNHIGYFIMLNQNGSPISIDDNNLSDTLSSVSGTQRVNNLFNAFYGASQFSISSKMSADAKTEILNSIYDSFINNMMHTKLDKLGLDKHRVELSSSLSRVMLTRLLKNAQTRILFVPKKLMLYLTFQYNADGTGRSKIDNIKFPLSLKMTLIITRLISLIESSVNRRALNITLDDGIGNPVELLRTIKKDIMSNKVYGISYDPSTIIKSILDKELTIVPSKIPGVQDFSLTDTPNNVDYPKPDDAILSEINNMYMLSLGVPPSAMNRLNEDEFSRSVASNNIFFSNQLKTYQKSVCSFMTTYITTYIHFSKKLRESILAILQEETGMSANVGGRGIEATIEAVKDRDEKDTETPNGTTKPKDKTEDDPKKDELVDPKKAIEADDKKSSKKEDEKKATEDKDGGKKLSPEERLMNIIANIRFTLPSPTLAQDKSSFEELKDYVEIIDLVLTNMFPDDMIADTDLANVVKTIRSSIKRTILQEHLKSNSLLSDLNFDVLNNMDVVGPATTMQKVMNIKASLDQMVKAFADGGDTNMTDTGNTGGTDTGEPPTTW